MRTHVVVQADLSGRSRRRNRRGKLWLEGVCVISKRGGREWGDHSYRASATAEEGLNSVSSFRCCRQRRGSFQDVRQRYLNSALRRQRLAAWTYGAWAKMYCLGLLFDLLSFLSLSISCSPGGRQFRLVLENRTCLTVVFSDCVLQHLTGDTFLQETRDLCASFLAIFLFGFNVTTTPLGRSFLGPILDFGWSISWSEPPVGVLLSMLGQGSRSLGFPDLSLIVR